MTSTTYATDALPRPRRSIVPASLLQWLTWALVVTLVLGPFLPLAYASIRDRPLYESGGVFTLEPYRELLRERAFWHAWWNTLQFAVLTTAMAVAPGAAVVRQARPPAPPAAVARDGARLDRGLGRGRLHHELLQPAAAHRRTRDQHDLRDGARRGDEADAGRVPDLPGGARPRRFVAGGRGAQHGRDTVAGASQHHDPDAEAGAPELGDVDLHALDRRARDPAPARRAEQHPVRLELPVHPLDERHLPRPRCGQRRRHDPAPGGDAPPRRPQPAARRRGTVRLGRRQGRQGRLPLATQLALAARGRDHAVSALHDAPARPRSGPDVVRRLPHPPDRPMGPAHLEPLAGARRRHLPELDPEQPDHRARRCRAVDGVRRSGDARRAPLDLPAATHVAVRDALSACGPRDHHRDRLLLGIPAHRCAR